MKLRILMVAVVAIFTVFTNNVVLGQAADSLKKNEEFTQLEAALKNPEKVYRLNLDNQNLKNISLAELSKFKNLQYLSLRNDDLTVLPSEILTLQNLRVLDLGDNKIEVLPREFSKLRNLEELYLDNDPSLDLYKSFKVLSALPKLKILHLDNDGIRRLPRNIKKLTHMESLYLGNNLLQFVPPEVKGIQSLKYLDLNHNKITLDLPVNQVSGPGLKIKF